MVGKGEGRIEGGKRVVRELQKGEEGSRLGKVKGGKRQEEGFRLG